MVETIKLEIGNKWKLETHNKIETVKFSGNESEYPCHSMFGQQRVIRGIACT